MLRPWREQVALIGCGLLVLFIGNIIWAAIGAILVHL